MEHKTTKDHILSHWLLKFHIMLYDVFFVHNTNTNLSFQLHCLLSYKALVMYRFFVFFYRLLIYYTFIFIYHFCISQSPLLYKMLCLNVMQCSCGVMLVN